MKNVKTKKVTLKLSGDDVVTVLTILKYARVSNAFVKKGLKIAGKIRKQYYHPSQPV